MIKNGRSGPCPASWVHAAFVFHTLQFGKKKKTNNKGPPMFKKLVQFELVICRTTVFGPLVFLSLSGKVP